MSASSQYGLSYQAAYGRLKGDRGGGWCAQQAARNDDWLQVDLGKSIEPVLLLPKGTEMGVNGLRPSRYLIPLMEQPGLRMERTWLVLIFPKENKILKC